MVLQRLFRNLISILTGICLFWAKPVIAGLPPGNAVTDATAILRDALPIHQEELQTLQHKLESSGELIRGNRWPAVKETITSSEFLLNAKKQKIISAIPKSNQIKSEQLLNILSKELEELSMDTEERKKEKFYAARQKSLDLIGDLESLLIGEFPFEIPKEFDELPRLLGRATVEIKTTKGNMNAVIDGYNAPLTGGAFIDLVVKGFYDGLPFTRAEDFYVLQTGDPEGSEIGYIEPQTNKERHVPLEIKISEESQPFYNQTFDDLGIYKSTPVLPFAASGTLGWAHSNISVDDGSSQFFFHLYEAELTPAGRNLIDGRNAAFGYVIEGAELLQQIDVDDRILSIKVLDGEERLVSHG